MKSTLVVLSLLLLQCTSPQVQKPEPVGRGWAETMHDLSVRLSELLPLTSRKEVFESPEGQKKVALLTAQMADLATEINRTAARPDADPSLKYFTQLFEEDMNRAKQSLTLGQIEYARHLLRNTTSYCVSCHSRSNDGPEFASLHLNEAVSALGPIERAEFYAATRQFTRASDEFDRVLNDKSVAQSHPFNWEQAARFALALNVRVRQNPQAALKDVELMSKAKETAAFAKEDAAAWKRSLRDWLKEKPAPLTSSEARLKEAKRLISRGKALQKYPLDRAGDIEYLRASSHLHDILRAPLDGEPRMYQEAIYYSGLAAEAVRDLNFWSLHETYYEICVRFAPHSELARTCFDRLQASVLAGYSGSGGTSVPPEAQKRLNDLSQLAKPE